MRDKPLRASAAPLPELNKPFTPSLKTSSPTSTAVMSPVMGKKILLLYRRENGIFVWKNKPGLRLTEDNPIINDIENETRIGELLSVISEHMAKEKVLQNYEFVCSWRSLALARYYCVLVSQIEGSVPMPSLIQLPSPVPSNETTSTGTQTAGPALPSERTTGTPNERDALRIRFGKLIARENPAPARNDARAGPGPVARERIETPANQLQRPRYLDHDAWRKAANEYETDPANQLWD